MEIYKENDYAAMSRKGADILAAQVILKPHSVLGLATGGTPRGMYAEIARRHRQEGLDFSKAWAFNLDEYVGLEGEHPQSYAYYMAQNLFSHINMPPQHIDIPRGMAEDAGAECRRYDAAIAARGGMDLQVLGLGLNGHIGFNEPGADFRRDTFCVALSPSTIEANSRFFDKAEDVPRHALTMGIGPIMGARRILMLVSGLDKAGIIREAFRGPITPAVPASILQLHPHVILVGDADALSQL